MHLPFSICFQDVKTPKIGAMVQVGFTQDIYWYAARQHKLPSRYTPGWEIYNANKSIESTFFHMQFVYLDDQAVKMKMLWSCYHNLQYVHVASAGECCETARCWFLSILLENSTAVPAPVAHHSTAAATSPPHRAPGLRSCYHQYLLSSDDCNCSPSRGQWPFFAGHRRHGCRRSEGVQQKGEDSTWWFCFEWLIYTYIISVYNNSL